MLPGLLCRQVIRWWVEACVCVCFSWGWGKIQPSYAPRYTDHEQWCSWRSERTQSTQLPVFYTPCLAAVEGVWKHMQNVAEGLKIQKTSHDESGVIISFRGPRGLNNKLYNWAFFFSLATHSHRHHCQRSAHTSRSGGGGGNFPDDISCFLHNIDVRAKAAGGLLVTFHITWEENAELYTYTNCYGRKEDVGREGSMDEWADRHAMYWRFLSPFSPLAVSQKIFFVQLLTLIMCFCLLT